MHVADTPPFRPTRGPAFVLTAQNTTPTNRARCLVLLHLFRCEHHAPLLEAVGRDQIALSFNFPEQAPPLSRLDKARKPAVLVVADDDSLSRFGPAGWPFADRMLRWSRGLLVHASGGRPEHYTLAVQGALVARKLLVIETCSWRANAWLEAAQRFMPLERILQIHPHPGEVHPILPEAETVQ